MTATPKIGAPLWTASDETPWLGANKADRLFDAFTLKTSVIDRDLTAPPGSCADGARYMVASGATGAWEGKDGQLAIAHGTNAASGWIFCPLEIPGMMIRIEDEDVVQLYNGGWTTPATPPQRVQDFPDVDLTGMADGNVLKWDASNGIWYPGSDVGDALGGTFRGAMVKKSVDQTAANYTTETTLTWDAEVYDTDGIHDNVTNNSRLTVPAGVTKVRLWVGVTLGSVTSRDWVTVAIYKDGSADYDGKAMATTEAATAAPSCEAQTAILEVVAGNYFEAKLQVQSDTSITVPSASCFFAMEIIE